LKYALAIVRQTRVGEKGIAKFISDHVMWGAGPRAVQYLVLAAKARAILRGRASASCEDVAALAAPVLRHRIVMNFSANADDVTADRVVARIVAETPQREDEWARDKRFAAILGS
jgi:MoxR-like ATPase